ncbi:MAG: T9SS type A sorting domain-containing protein [Ignavibacteriales bacterium]|nr:T9SS type A sorting domain-containing protein [Ignavibacteriales bacterium]
MLRKEGGILLFLLLIISGDLFPQTLSFQPHRFGQNLFAGGIDNPRFKFVDIDGDADNDLFIFDRDEQLLFYRNEQGAFYFEPQQTFGISVGSWFHFVDIDGDGDQDCFTNGEFSEVRLYTNTGNASAPSFQMTVAVILDTSGNEMFSERFSVPTFADIDADGDFDFFSGSQSGAITFYRNVGTPPAPKFAFVTNEFDGIKIIGGGKGLPKSLHGASGIEFFDSDSNGTLDLFWGDYFNPSMYVLKNIGTVQSAHYVLTDSTYPKEDIVNTFGFNIPQHVDIDGDGITDLMVGSVHPTEGYNNFWFYKNIGSNKEPFYLLQTKNFVPMYDVGVRSSVSFADYDGNGDMDMGIASGDGTINIYLNTGTATQPSFSLVPTFQHTLNAFFVTVTSGDVNNDGKPDLLTGEFSGVVRYFQNTTVSNTISFVQTPFPLDTIDIGNSSAPCIADIDQDGIRDVLVGTSAGTLYFYKNTGTNSSPVYSFISSTFNSIDVGNDAMPFVADLDFNGRNDLLIGNGEGNIVRYEYNLLTQKYDSVNAFFGSINAKINASPVMTDIDSDGDLDLFVGNGKGGVYYFANTTVNAVNGIETRVPFSIALQQNYPNPFNPGTTISFVLSQNSYVRLEIYDMLGRNIDILVEKNLQKGEHSVFWNATKFPSGTYFYRLSVLSNNSISVTQTRPMVLIK